MKPPLRPQILKPLYVNAFSPPMGEKKVYLPNFTLTLLRTPHAPPHWASFLVPLNLNKLDLKDYLYHAYGLQVLRVRSYVIQAKVRKGKPGTKIPDRRWFRPRATKKMTVELVQNKPGQGAFIWPDPPEDLSPWDKKIWDKAKEEQQNERKRQGLEGLMEPKDDVQSIAEQARRLRAGEDKWRPGWMDYGIQVLEKEGSRAERLAKIDRLTKGEPEGVGRGVDEG